MSTESSLQKLVKKRLTAAGCFVIKVDGIGRRGFPDLFVRSKRMTVLLEIKHPGGTGRLSKHQEAVHRELTDLGQKVVTIATEEELEQLIRIL